MFFKDQKKVTREELINRAFQPKDNVIDIMFLFPPTSTGIDYAHRYGKKDLGDLKGDLIPLGIASLAAYLRKFEFGIAALDCIALELTHDEIVNIVRKRKPRSVGISATTYALPASTTLAERLRKEFPDLLNKAIALDDSLIDAKCALEHAQPTVKKRLDMIKSNCFVNELAASRNSGKINPTIRTTKDRAIARIIKPIVWGNFRNLKLITEKTEANKRRTVESSNISIIVFL